MPVATSISRRPVVPLDADLSEMRRPFADVVVVGDHRAQLELERSPDGLLRHLEQLLISVSGTSSSIGKPQRPPRPSIHAMGCGEGGVANAGSR